MLHSKDQTDSVFFVGTCNWGSASRATEVANLHSIVVDSVEAFLASEQDVRHALCVFVYADGSVDWQSLHQALLKLRIDIPVFAVSADEDLAKTSEAAKPFANFVLKLPIDEKSMSKALSLARSNHRIVELQFSIERSHQRLGSLNEREQTILAMAVDGAPNKKIASQLDLHIKTIERIRHSAYAKLGVRSTAEMSRMMTLADLHDFVYWTEEPDEDASAARHVDYSAPRTRGYFSLVYCLATAKRRHPI